MATEACPSGTLVVGLPLGGGSALWLRQRPGAIVDRKTEQRVIRKAAAGDRDAAAKLIRTHQQSLYAYMLRMCGKPDLAEDVVQEAFVRVLSNLHRFDERFRFSTWLFTIAKRLYINAVAKMRPAYDTDTVGAARSNQAGPEVAADLDERRDVQGDVLQSALSKLSVEQREVLILFHQQDWPIALIAQHLDMPEGTVKSHLHRGRKRLRELVERQETLATKLAGVWQ